MVAVGSSGSPPGCELFLPLENWRERDRRMGFIPLSEGLGGEE